MSAWGLSNPVGRHVNRSIYLATFLALSAAAGAALAGPREDLGREILRRVPDWPGTEVAIPISVYEQYLRELMRGPVPPQPPQVVWVERASYRFNVTETEAEIETAMEIVCLPGTGPRGVRLLPTDLAWREAAVDGRKTDLRRADDGWLHFEAAEPGRFRVVARATVKPMTAGDERTLEFGTPPAAWTTCTVDAAGAWDVRFSRSPLAIVGTDAGTRGTVGLAAGDGLQVAWRRPAPPVHRAAQIAVSSQVGWTVADGVHQVRAVLDVRLWGGEAAELAVTLPPGAERVSITGPDVREVQVQPPRARVFLRGAITQRTRLDVAFEASRPATGRMSLAAFGIEGANLRGGTLAIAGGAGGVLLEMESPGLVPMALADLPDETRALLTGPPVYAYSLSGRWEAQVDLVGMSEFPVRETLVDSALYTVLYRPDGRVMTKVIYEVRNRAQQYMAVDLPAGAQIVVARVAEVQRNLARGPGQTVYVPLEKSVLTTAGLVSFPVEVVYVMAAEPLGRRGRFRLALPRTDLPVAYARCALMLPDGMKTGEWGGVLRLAQTWSSETANIEFEYGTGHLAAGVPEKPAVRRAPAPKTKPKPPGLIAVLGGFFAKPDLQAPAVLPPPETPPEAPERERARADEDERTMAQGRIVQGKNLYRAGVDYYQRNDYAKARDLFSQVIVAAPQSLEADNARKYLGNVEVALGLGLKDEKSDRGLRATAKAVQKGQQMANVEERDRQKELLSQAQEALRRGDEEQAEAAYKVAVNLSGKLQTRGEEAQEQKAVVREAERFLKDREARRKEQGDKVARLREEVSVLRQSISKAGGEEAGQVVDALITDAPAMGDIPILGTGLAPGIPAGPGVATGETAGVQIEMEDALAEQQVGQSGRGTQGGRWGGVRARGYATIDADQKVEQLRKQLEALKSIKGQLVGHAAARFEPGGKEAAAPQPVEMPPGLDLGRQVITKAKGLAAEAKEATKLAREGRLAEADQMVRRLEKKAEATELAAKVIAGKDAGTFGIAGGGGERTSGLAPSSKPYGGAKAATPAAVAWDVASRAAREEVRQSLSEAKATLKEKTRDLDKVQFSVSDVAGDDTNGDKLANFIESNYSWAFRGGQADSSGLGAQPAAQAGAYFFDAGEDLDSMAGAGRGPDSGRVQVTGGTLVVANDPASVSRIQTVLERLRTNMGQRVSVASRNIFVPGRTAGAVGVQWQTGANSVRYAVINEGQLMGLLDVEQRRHETSAAAASARNAYQEAVVGTEALVANGQVVLVERAADTGNTLGYNGNSFQVAHDDYVVVDNGVYLTAVKSGRMQHWATEAAPVRFPGVPAAVVVPAVGHTVKFEKTLLDASDALELAADYTWEGEER